ncbi:MULTISPECIES: hypothetical protein [unclassified Mesorhizobium]|uniref:hypothetical protein n=1 Tax=unclassified Mesorhizobium TaxID=325217 RepID=UPI003335EC62
MTSKIGIDFRNDHPWSPQCLFVHGCHAESAISKSVSRAYLLNVEEKSCCPAKETVMSTISARRGFFRNAVKALIEARQREASRYVSGVLLGFDDETLKAHGYDREQLKKAANSR